jgi:N-acetylglucosaminyl-diphospho-decaprenol L-rhamnosyltransferase
VADTLKTTRPEIPHVNSYPTLFDYGCVSSPHRILRGPLMEAVIVTYNSERDLSSLVASTDLLRTFSRVLVVDNASTDNSLAVARTAGFDTAARSVNDGFGAAANAGINATSGDFVALLNPDIHIIDDATVPLMEAQFRDAAVAVTAPALELPNGQVQDSAREVPLPTDLIRRRVVNGLHGALVSPEPVNVPWVVGAFMVIRREAFDAVGGFDPRYHVYFEDVDLCVRLQNAGWRVRFVPTTRARHRHNAASRKSLLGWSTRQHIRSAGLFYRQHPRHIMRRDVASRPRMIA